MFVFMRRVAWRTSWTCPTPSPRQRHRRGKITGRRPRTTAALSLFAAAAARASSRRRAASALRRRSAFAGSGGGPCPQTRQASPGAPGAAPDADLVVIILRGATSSSRLSRTPPVEGLEAAVGRAARPPPARPRRRLVVVALVLFGGCSPGPRSARRARPRRPRPSCAPPSARARPGARRSACRRSRSGSASPAWPWAALALACPAAANWPEKLSFASSLPPPSRSAS